MAPQAPSVPARSVTSRPETASGALARVVFRDQSARRVRENSDRAPRIAQDLLDGAPAVQFAVRGAPLSVHEDLVAAAIRRVLDGLITDRSAHPHAHHRTARWTATPTAAPKRCLSFPISVSGGQRVWRRWTRAGGFVVAGDVLKRERADWRRRSGGSGGAGLAAGERRRAQSIAAERRRRARRAGRVMA